MTENLYENRNLGPNHQDWCIGSGAYYSGKGYNRVIVCPCGAEDYAPEPSSLKVLLDPNLKGDPKRTQR